MPLLFGMLLAILVIIATVYIALFAVVWGALSLVLPPDVCGPVAVAILILGTVVLLWRSAAASTLLGRVVVRRQHLARMRRLAPDRVTYISSVTPVRLAGVGGRRERFDLSLIDLRPDTKIGSVRASELSAARKRNLYLVATLHELALWTHHWLSFRHILTFDREQVEKTGFIEHNPDRLAPHTDHERRYVGTFDITCPGGQHVYLFVRIKPPSLNDGT